MSRCGAQLGANGRLAYTLEFVLHCIKPTLEGLFVQDRVAEDGLLDGVLEAS